MSLIAKITPDSWFDINITMTMELVSTFIEIVEEQAAESTERYRNEVEGFIPEGYKLVENEHRITIEGYKGLFSHDWDLDSLFINHFPNLQRRSALLSIIGIFETELNNLCYLYQEERKIKVGLKDLQGAGFERAIAYLDKVVELDTAKNSQSWNEIKNIQKIRNIIAHRDGNLSDKKGNIDKQVSEYIQNNDFLNGDNEVIVECGFLNYVLNVFKGYLKLLEKAAKGA